MEANNKELRTREEIAAVLVSGGFTTKKGHMKAMYECKLCEIVERETLRPVKWHGKGKNLEDKSSNYLDLLSSLGIAYTTGNDAPRGGKEGYFVKIEPCGNIGTLKYLYAQFKEMLGNKNEYDRINKVWLFDEYVLTGKII